MNNIRAKGGRPDKIIFNSDIKRAYVGDTLVYNLSDFIFESTATEITFPVTGGNVNLGFISMFTGPDNENELCKFELIVPDWITYEESTFNSQSFVFTATNNSSALDARKGEIIARQKYSNNEIKIPVFQDCNFGVVYSNDTAAGCYYMMPNSRRLITYQQAVDNNINKEDVEGIVVNYIPSSGTSRAFLIYKELIVTDYPDDSESTSSLSIGFCEDYRGLLENYSTITDNEERAITLYLYLKHKNSKHRVDGSQIQKQLLQSFVSPIFSDGTFGHIPHVTLVTYLAAYSAELYNLCERINLFFDEESDSTSTTDIFALAPNTVIRVTRNAGSYTFSLAQSQLYNESNIIKIASSCQKIGALIIHDLNSELQVHGIVDMYNDLYHNNCTAAIAQYNATTSQFLYGFDYDNTQSGTTVLPKLASRLEDITDIFITTSGASVCIGTFGNSTNYIFTGSSPGTYVEKSILQSWREQKDLMFLFSDNLPDIAPNLEYGTNIADIDVLPEGVYIHSINDYVYTKNVWKLHNYSQKYADGILIIRGGRAALFSKSTHGFVRIVLEWTDGAIVTSSDISGDYEGYNNWLQILQYYNNEKAGSILGNYKDINWFFNEPDEYLPSFGEMLMYYYNYNDAEQILELIGGNLQGNSKAITSSATSIGLTYLFKPDDTSSYFLNGVLVGDLDITDADNYCFRMCKKIPYRQLSGYVDELPDGVYLSVKQTLYNARSYVANKESLLQPPLAVVIKERNEVFGYSLVSTPSCRMCNYIDNPPVNLTSLDDTYDGEYNTQWLLDNGHSGSDYAATVATSVDIAINSSTGVITEQCFMGNYNDWSRILKYSEQIKRAQNIIGSNTNIIVKNSWVSTLSGVNTAYYIRNGNMGTSMANLVSDNDGYYYVTPCFKFTID